MHCSRSRLHGFVWVFLAALWMQGCQARTARMQEIQPPGIEDTFGDLEQELITEDSIFDAEMIRQRAQFEMRFGGTFPFGIVRPGVDSETDPGFSLGGKFSIEAYKNLFLGVSADWTAHNVNEPPGGVAGDNQIQIIDNYDQFNFLLTADYDIPLTLTGAWEGLIFRLGGGMGITWVKFTERPGTRNIESWIQFNFRPSVALRYPIYENVLLFTEASYNVIPERGLETTESERVEGERPVFSGFSLWLGVAFEWD